jgi:hypothetical protein
MNRRETNGVCLYLMEYEKHNDTRDLYNYIDRPKHFEGESRIDCRKEAVLRCSDMNYID